jgi:hypothetical protein
MIVFFQLSFFTMISSFLGAIGIAVSIDAKSRSFTPPDIENKGLSLRYQHFYIFNGNAPRDLQRRFIISQCLLALTLASAMVVFIAENHIWPAAYFGIGCVFMILHCGRIIRKHWN